jgi:hypothetical protein
MAPSPRWGQEPGRSRFTEGTGRNPAPERVAQRFYIAFCLLMASVQDSMLGLREKESRNHNWSATCSYYSMVHVGRLLCFLAFGDYPTSHKRLRGVFSSVPAQQANRAPLTDAYPFDWLARFSSFQAGRRVNPGVGRPRRPNDAYGTINNCLAQSGVVDAALRLERFGAILAAAGPLRNDSNYEALLIAHEFRHESITPAFGSLALHMATGAELGVDLAVDAFNGFRESDPDVEKDKAAYEAFLHEYVHDRIGAAIRHKVDEVPAIEARLAAVLARIGTRSEYGPYSEIEVGISTAAFLGKASLMTEFQSGVGNLERVVRNAASWQRHLDS